MTDADAHSDERRARFLLGPGTSIVRAARWLLVRIELTTAFLCGVPGAHSSDMFLSSSPILVLQLKWNIQRYALWRRSYEWADLRSCYSLRLRSCCILSPKASGDICGPYSTRLTP